jgi:hypothetical protein
MGDDKKKKKGDSAPRAVPVRRMTIEVEASWLEPEPDGHKLTRGRKGPPPLPGGKAIPPMPGAPPRRDTIEVQAEWLERSPESLRPGAGAARKTPTVPPVIAPKKQGALAKPLPREEPDETPQPSRSKGSTRTSKPPARRSKSPPHPSRRPQGR